MPRIKDDPTKWSPERYAQEAQRLDALAALQAGIGKLIPDALTPKTVMDLVKTRSRGGRAALSLTLDTDTIKFIEMVSTDTGLSRGMVIDWALRSLVENYLDFKNKTNTEGDWVERRLKEVRAAREKKEREQKLKDLKAEAMTMPDDDDDEEDE